MASDSSKRLQKIVAGVLDGRGFIKKGQTWRKAYDNAIGVVNIQGSQWGRSFYVNFGVYFSALGGNPAPLEYHCHIRTRLEELTPARARLVELLDLESSVPDAVRSSEIESAIANAVPWLDRVATISGAREYCSAIKPTSPWVTPDARKYLEIAARV